MWDVDGGLILCNWIITTPLSLAGTGLAEYPGDGDPGVTLIDFSVRTLHQVKHLGSNQVVRVDTL
jgi:hypothetical protein